ncbi:MAG: hypothetical protein IJ567_08490 [Lachnospiraceae bacterium]|nr:hypothetical protein [Lachnospiraceae bacterium]
MQKKAEAKASTGASTTKTSETKAKAADTKTATKTEGNKTAGRGTGKRGPAKGTTRKEAAKKADKKEFEAEVFVQFYGNEAGVNDIIEKAKEAFVAEGHRPSSIKSLKIYLKPEEYTAYYVINEKSVGRLNLF